MVPKTCLITGGNSGIGKAAAIQIASKGCRVIIACRNEERGISAVNEIRSVSGNADVEMILLDLSSKASIHEASKQIQQKNLNLDVLIHNAADFDISRKAAVFSEDGIEKIWATNHIGPVLLTNLLMEKIKAGKNGRILTIASKGLMMYPKLKIDFEDPEFRRRKFTVAKAYYQSKLAQVMYTYWLADNLKESNISVNCIRVTNVKIDIGRYPDLSKGSKIAYALKSRFSISPEKMAEVYSFLACEENLQSVTGKYFDENRKLVRSSEYSMRKENMDQLMELTSSYLY